MEKIPDDMAYKVYATRIIIPKQNKTKMAYLFIYLFIYLFYDDFGTSVVPRNNFRQKKVYLMILLSQHASYRVIIFFRVVR